MIINKEPLSMAEALKYVKKEEAEETDVIGFIKKFVKMKHAEATKLKERLKGLDMMKVRDEHIVKIIDLMPENAEELNKIFADVSLDDDEAQKILNEIKETK